MISSYPSGTVTFLFTDIEGSTKLAQEYSDDMPALIARHNEILDQAIQAQNGIVFRVVGDSYSAAFHTAQEALNAALEAQRKLQTEAWSPAPVKVRMGINTGAAKWKDDPKGPFYEGYATLALTQRVMSVGHGGQILISQTTHDLVNDKLPDNTELRDMGERRLKDIFKAEHLYQVASPGLLSDFPPLTTIEFINHNLPAQLTSFIGRERELAEVKALLASTRMLTFSGSGGTGKTRLSLQLAIEQLAEFKDGVWFIELAPLSDPKYVISTLASVFNLREVQGVPLIDTVTDYLRGKHLLLIFDNCEHLIEACARTADHLLHNCRNLKIIASSREALGINGETVYRVPSLSLPDEKSDFNSLLDYEATRLFTERAIKANPHFALTKDNASFVTQICSRLDGIPLAIELAAARLQLFTPQQIAERLDDRFKLLTGGSRTALPRQQTLRALIDWSYQTLNETEQRALRGLAVFSGGWSFEAVESILGGNEAMDGLSGLINKSLVNVDEQAGKSRYHFLETIRQYALDRLLESGETSRVRDLHLEYYVNLAEYAEEKLIGLEEGFWMARFELEHDNFRSALKWGLEKHAIAALKLVAALSHFWMTRGYLSEGRRWCQSALEGAVKLPYDGNDIDRIRARAFHALALLSINQGEHHAALTAAQAAVELARQIDDTFRLVRSLVVFGIASAFSGQIEQAFEAFHESEGIARRMGYKHELAWGLVSLAYITYEVHGLEAEDKVRPYLEEALMLTNAPGSPYAHRANEILARLAYYRGDLAEARKISAGVLTTYRETGDRLNYYGYQSAIAHALRQQGNWQDALALYHETLMGWQELGHRGAVSHQLECFAFIARVREQGEQAVKLLGAAETLRKVSNSSMTPNERAEYDKEVASLRAGMNEQDFSALWTEGRSMTMEQAIELALQS